MLKYGFKYHLNRYFHLYCNRSHHCAVVPAPPTVQAAQLTVTAGPQVPRPHAPRVPQRFPRTGTENVRSQLPHFPVTQRKKSVKLMSCQFLLGFVFLLSVLTHDCFLLCSKQSLRSTRTTAGKQKSWRRRRGERRGSRSPTRTAKHSMCMLQTQTSSTLCLSPAEWSKKSLKMRSAFPFTLSVYQVLGPARRSQRMVINGMVEIWKKELWRYRRWKAFQETEQYSVRGNRWCSEMKMDQERTRTSWWTQVSKVVFCCYCCSNPISYKYLLPRNAIQSQSFNQVNVF